MMKEKAHPLVLEIQKPKGNEKNLTERACTMGRVSRPTHFTVLISVLCCTEHYYNTVINSTKFTQK